MMNFSQGKNESADDFWLRFEAILNKTLAYEETLVENLFWGGVAF